MSLAEKDELAETLTLDRQDEPLGVRIQIRAARGQADRLDLSAAEEATKLSSEDRISIHDEMRLAYEEAIVGVEEISRDLHHPLPCRLLNDPANLNAAARQIDDEEHVVADEPV